jgi:MPBQ/MSBQ methyltransferase
MIVTADERDEVRAYLERAYAGVFGPEEVAFHLSAHLGDGFADYACQVIAAATPAKGRILDVGTGFGSFVVLARDRGFDAVGTDISDYEIAFARRRLARLRPSDDPESVFLPGGIFAGALDQRRFDAITFWNVLEHVRDIQPLLTRAAALLEPGGAVYIQCPNYAAFRREAHYQLPWRPWLSRAAAIRRIRASGKDPRFFETSVFQRTNWEVMRAVIEAGLQLHDRMNLVPMHLSTLLTAPRRFADFFNPLRASIELAARRPR